MVDVTARRRYCSDLCRVRAHRGHVPHQQSGTAAPEALETRTRRQQARGVRLEERDTALRKHYSDLAGRITEAERLIALFERRSI